MARVVYVSGWAGRDRAGVLAEVFLCKVKWSLCKVVIVPVLQLPAALTTTCLPQMPQTKTQAGLRSKLQLYSTPQLVSMFYANICKVYEYILISID
jgi:hypothetical protein